MAVADTGDISGCLGGHRLEPARHRRAAQNRRHLLVQLVHRGRRTVYLHRKRSYPMTEVQQLARFVTGTRYSQLSDSAVEQLKIRVLDTLGVAIGALDAEPLVAIRKLTESLGGNG